MYFSEIDNVPFFSSAKSSKIFHSFHSTSNSRIPSVYMGTLNVIPPKAYDTYLNPTGWFKVIKLWLAIALLGLAVIKCIHA